MVFFLWKELSNEINKILGYFDFFSTLANPIHEETAQWRGESVMSWAY
jgi:hypothetical protein